MDTQDEDGSDQLIFRKTDKRYRTTRLSNSWK